MGYNTFYSMKIQGISDETKFIKIQKEIEKTINNEELVFDSGIYSSSTRCAAFDGVEECHWYYFDGDMKNLSSKFPECIFRLTGIGEAFGDCWQSYYQNGLSEFCSGRVVYKCPKHIKWNEEYGVTKEDV